VIVPSIDIVAGRAVQLVGGEDEAMDAGDPRPILQRFARVGEVAVVDIDAARGEGDNGDLVSELCGMGSVRVGGGIRDAQAALSWLDAGAARVVIGTAADEMLLAALPKERVVVALDVSGEDVLSHGWRRRTGSGLFESIERFRDLCSGFLVTVVEREGRLQGADLDLARRVVEAAGAAKVTFAGGVTVADEVGDLDRLGADAQVGMALYTGTLHLADALAAPLVGDREDGLWPTVVVDEMGTALGLAWSSRESLRMAIDTGSGVYQSRRRGLWVKGETSGATQELLGVDVDCDRDTLRFRVRQRGGFCHLGTRGCWGEDTGLARLERRIRAVDAERPEGANTARLLDDPRLLSAKLSEEAGELGAPDADVAEETADLLYFALTRAVGAGVTLADVEAILDRRERRVTRRPLTADGGR